jgi:hypothetical protein
MWCPTRLCPCSARIIPPASNLQSRTTTPSVSPPTSFCDAFLGGLAFSRVPVFGAAECVRTFLRTRTMAAAALHCLLLLGLLSAARAVTVSTFSAPAYAAVRCLLSPNSVFLSRSPAGEVAFAGRSLAFIFSASVAPPLNLERTAPRSAGARRTVGLRRQSTSIQRSTERCGGRMVS